MEMEIMENINNNAENCLIDFKKVCRTCLNENTNLFEIDSHFLTKYIFSTFKLIQVSFFINNNCSTYILYLQFILDS